MQRWRFSRRPGFRPLLYAHRGARAHAPENTMAAFERGIADGADGIELDVRTTSDGEVIVLHDPDLARVTGKRDLRLAAELSLQELRRVELEERARVPTLAEVLDWASARDVLVNVELKHDTRDLAQLARGVVRLLRGRPRVAEHVVLSSFEPKLLGLCAALGDDTLRAFLFHDKQRFARTPLLNLVALAVSAAALHPERTLCSPGRVRAWRKTGRLLNVWTVNDGGEARDLADLGVDGLITDDPGAILAVLNAARTGRD
jgi:glycerophosphoryl diester phosphodiesterase